MTVAVLALKHGSMLAASRGSDDHRTELVAGVVLLLAIILIRQFAVRQVSSTFYVWVALLLVIGLAGPGPRDQHGAGLGYFAVTLVVSAVFGVLRGVRMPLWREPDGRVLRKGDGVVAALWVATIVTRLVLDGIGVAVLDLPFYIGDIYVAVAVTLAVQQVVLQRRGDALPVRAKAR